MRRNHSRAVTLWLVLVATSTSLLACRLNDGSSTGPGGAGGLVIWKVPSDNPKGTPHAPAANADRTMAYFVTPEYRLRKIRGSDGKLIWDVPVGSPRLTFLGWNAVVSGGNVIVVKTDLFAFDTTTGAARWTYVAPDLNESGYSPIVADDSTVFAAGRVAQIYAVDSRTGIARWILDLREGRGDAMGALNPSLADGTLYVCTRTIEGPSIGSLWAINASNGVVRWRHRFTPELPQQGARCFGDAAVWRDLVIQPQEDGRVFAFERATGTVRWIAPRVHDVTLSWGDMRFAAAGAATVLVTSQAVRGGIFAYDAATGTELWRRTDVGGSLGTPAIDGDIAYVDHGWIYASYEMSTGKVRWQTPASFLQPEAPFKARPVIARDRIYVAGRDGSYALKR